MDRRGLWIDASAGIAGDMLLGALLDAGASIDTVRGAIDTVAGAGNVELDLTETTRAGMRAARLRVSVPDGSSRARSWGEIERLLRQCGLGDSVKVRSLQVFSKLAEAEARVHALSRSDVHFHEAGAWDSIADIVGACAAIEDLGIDEIVGSRVALGYGTVQSWHGELPVPVPAVLELSRGWGVVGRSGGELATPTGMALLRSFAPRCGGLPDLFVTSVGVGAGLRDHLDWPNVTRVVVGELRSTQAFAQNPTVEIESNVDDLDPRIWPSVLERMLALGACDVWLTPIVMKKGRPAHTVHVLCYEQDAARLGLALMEHTTTFGYRLNRIERAALDRDLVKLVLRGHPLRVKISIDSDGVIIHTTPEYRDVERISEATGVAIRRLLAEATATAASAGVVPGRPAPHKVSREARQRSPRG